MIFLILYPVPSLKEGLDLYRQGKCHEALSALSPIINHEWLTREVEPPSPLPLLLYLLVLDELKEHEQVSLFLEKVSANHNVYYEYGLFFELVWLSTLLFTRRYEEFSALSKSILDTIATSHHSIDLLSEYHNLLGRYYLSRGDLGESLSHYQKGLGYKEELGDEYGALRILNNVGLATWRNGKLNDAHDVFNRVHEFSQRMGFYLLESRALLNLGSVELQRGNLAKAHGYIESALEIKYGLDLPLETAFALSNMGAVLTRMGRFDEALSYYGKSLSVLNNLGREDLIMTLQNNIGALLHKQGDLNRALEYYNKSLELRLKDGDPLKISLAFHNIGETYRELGDLEESESYLLRALESRREADDKYGMSDTLFELILLRIRQGMHSRATELLKELDQIRSHLQNKVVDLRHELASALLLKNSTRIREKIYGAEKLRKIIEAPVINHYHTLTAMKALFDLLLLEYETLKAEEVEDEIRDLLEELYGIAVTQHSSSLMVETHSLQAKFALIEGDLQRSKELLDEAKKIASERGVAQHMATINTNLELLRDEFEHWSQLVKDNLRVYSEVVDSLTRSSKVTVDVLEDGISKFNTLKALPLLLSDYKTVLHPIKLTILKVLQESTKIARNELLKLLNVNSGTLDKHIKQLASYGYLGTKVEIIEEKPRKVIYLESTGAQIYREFRDTMKQVIV